MYDPRFSIQAYRDNLLWISSDGYHKQKIKMNHRSTYSDKKMADSMQSRAIFLFVYVEHHLDFRIIRKSKQSILLAKGYNWKFLADVKIDKPSLNKSHPLLDTSLPLSLSFEPIPCLLMPIFSCFLSQTINPYFIFSFFGPSVLS